MLQALSTVTLHQFKPTLSPCVPKCCAVLSSMVHPLGSLLFRIWFMLDLNTEKSHTICTARPVANKVPYSIQLLLCGKYGYARIWPQPTYRSYFAKFMGQKKIGQKIYTSNNQQHNKPDKIHQARIKQLKCSTFTFIEAADLICCIIEHSARMCQAGLPFICKDVKSLCTCAHGSPISHSLKKNTGLNFHRKTLCMIKLQLKLNYIQMRQKKSDREKCKRGRSSAKSCNLTKQKDSY